MPKAYNLRLISINSDDISQNFVYNSRYDKTKDNLDFFFFGDEITTNGKIGLKSVVQKLTLQGPRWWGGQIGFNLSHPSAKREKTTFLSRGPPNWPMNTRVFAHSCLSLNQKNFRSCSGRPITFLNKASEASYVYCWNYLNFIAKNKH